MAPCSYSSGSRTSRKHDARRAAAGRRRPWPLGWPTWPVSAGPGHWPRRSRPSGSAPATVTRHHRRSLVKPYQWGQHSRPTPAIRGPRPRRDHGPWCITGDRAFSVHGAVRRRAPAENGAQLLGRAGPPELLERVLDIGMRSPLGRQHRGVGRRRPRRPRRDGAVLGRHDHREWRARPAGGPAWRGLRWWWRSSSTPTPTGPATASRDKARQRARAGALETAPGPCRTGSSTAASPLLVMLLAATDAGLGRVLARQLPGRRSACARRWASPPTAATSALCSWATRMTTTPRRARSTGDGGSGRGRAPGTVGCGAPSG